MNWLRRYLPAAALTFLAVPALMAVGPSARYEAGMVYDPGSTHMLLYGGLTGVDSGTKKAYHLGDTWEWTGLQWIQRFPASSPTARSGHAMVFDSDHGRVVLFGGRDDTGDLNDTWVYRKGDWSQVATPNAPPPRAIPGAAYDPLRDRTVLFGGSQTSADGKTVTPVYDTWEFDGTTWTQIGGTGPSVSKPILAYDVARDQVLMLGLDASLNTLMYAYDATAGVWNKLTPTTLPPCVNGGVMTYQSSDLAVVYTGGVCASSSTTDATYEWDGTNWSLITAVFPNTRLFGASVAFDDSRQLAVMFGGVPVLGSPVNYTYLYSAFSWLSSVDSTRPDGRSLFAFATDPVNQTIWMFGGTDGTNTFVDFWQYHNGDWQQVVADNAPSACTTPTGAFDTDRSRLVISCAEGDTFEWDGTTWTNPTPKTVPTFHQFASMVYDQTLKKTVLFGGYNSGTYLSDAWTWDGTNWTRITKNPPPGRTLTAMWYDPTLKKTVIYGGLGRLNSTDRVTRYDDMWTFDGTGWTLLKPPSGTPGLRYGAQLIVDPRTNQVLLFGGLRTDTVPPVPPQTEPQQVQSYVNDMWLWDGTNWTQMQPGSVPPARENGRIAYDPTRDELVLFGGYAGSTFSDVWTYNPTAWQVHIFDPLGNRRRVTH